MYRNAQQIEWDNQNALDGAKEDGFEEGLEKGALAKTIEIARSLKAKGFDIAMLAELTKLSKEQIQAL